MVENQSVEDPAISWVTRNVRRVPEEYRRSIVRYRDDGKLEIAIDGISAAVVGSEVDIEFPDKEIDAVVQILTAMGRPSDAVRVERELSRGRRGVATPVE
jgi:hypothetical protein